MHINGSPKTGVNMEVAAHPEEGAFYLLQPDMGGGRGHGLVFEDKQSIPVARHLSASGTGGLSALEATPRLRYDHHRGDMPTDLESGFKGYWLVSDALKKVFEVAAPDEFNFARCVLVLEDEMLEESHFLCEVVNTIDAIDERASEMTVLTEGYPNGKYYSIAGGGRLAFRKEVVNGMRVFRTPYTSDVFCSRALRDALVENGFGVGGLSRGVDLMDAASL